MHMAAVVGTIFFGRHDLSFIKVVAIFCFKSCLKHLYKSEKERVATSVMKVGVMYVYTGIQFRL